MQLKALAIALLGACSAAPPAGNGGDDTNPPPDGGTNPDGGGTNPDGGGTNPDGGGPNPSGWTQIALVDEPGIPRSGNDLVSGLYFTSPTSGFIVTQGAEESFGSGGAVFDVNGSNVSLAFSGKDGGPTLIGTVDFTGLEATPSGYVAMAYSADVVLGTPAGAFSIVKDGDLDGIEPLLAFHETAAGSTIVRETGVVSTTTDAPGPNATFTDVWAPNATEPIPNPVPAEMCQGGPMGTGAPVTRYSAYIGSNLIAYTAAPNFDPQICISTDGGHSFYPSFLTVTDDDTQYPPTGVMFASATTGISWFGQPNTTPYIQRTTDSGATWTSVPVPGGVATHSLELHAGFFAPDGQHGWIAGYDHDTSKALALATTDGGASWAVTATGLGDVQLYSGFALDATHVWLGGSFGTVIYKSN